MPSSQIIQTPHRRHVTYNERLRELGFVSVAKGRSRGNLIAAYNGLKSSWSADRPKFTPVVAGIQVVNITNYSLDASDLINVINKIPGSSGTGRPVGWCNIDSWRVSRLSWSQTRFIRDSAGNVFDSRLPKAASIQLFYDLMKKITAQLTHTALLPDHRIIETLRLEKSTKIIKSNLRCLTPQKCIR